MTKVKRSPTAWIQAICVLYLCVWSISPPLEMDSIYRLLALGCVALWCGLALTRHLRLSRINTCGVFLALLVVVVSLIEHDGFSKVLSQISLYMLVVMGIMFFFYKSRLEELSGLLLIIVVLLCIWNCRTATELFIDPRIARMIVRNDPEMYRYLRQGVGGYSLIYSQVCIFPMILSWTISALRKHKLYFALGCIWLTSFVTLIFKAGYSIAIFTCIASTLILFFYKRKNAIPAVLISVMILVGFLLLLIYSPGVRSFLTDLFSGTAIEKKIHDLMRSVTSRQAEGSILDRVICYQESLACFFKYPITGGLWFKSGGGHSAILDVFAKFGVVGGGIYSAMICYAPVTIKKQASNAHTIHMMNALLVSMLFVALLDSYTYTFMCIILLIVPLMNADIQKWSVKK